MPQPAISIHSLPRARKCGVLRSISKLGSVYGKKWGRNRIPPEAMAYLLLKPLGLVLASVILVFISAFGGHEFKVKEVAIMSVVLVIFSVLVFVKGLSLLPTPGNAPQRIVETPAGMLNAIGLQNIGVERFVRDVVPRLADAGATFAANIYGRTIEEYEEVARRLSEVASLAAIELNASAS